MAEVSGYSRLQIALHWGIMLLIILNYLTSDAMSAAWRALRDGKDAYGTTAALHVWVGVAILALVLVRLAVRLTRGAPEVPAGTPVLFRRGAQLAHIAIYGLLIAMPAAGIAAWFGGIGAAGEAHEVMFNLLFLIVLAHVGGALFHQLVLKDHLIARMMKAN
ncbi:MAG: cytochrome b [Albidovulum sp.]